MKLALNSKKSLNSPTVKSLKHSSDMDNFCLILLALPGFLLVFIFNYLPMAGIVLAFKNFNPNLGIWASPWVGFDNFKFFFLSNDFSRLMRNTILYSLWFIVVDNIAAIAFAIMCYNVKKKAALKYYQTAAILPSFMSIVLISYIVYAILAPTTGILNNVITALGGKGKDWYANASYWPAILTVIEVWKSIGYGSLIYYAAMVGIEESLFEAAKIDGANKWNQIRHVIIPALGALICLKVIMGVGHAMSGDFGLFYQVPRNIGLLYETTDILNTYIFRALQTGSSMGRTTAIGLFQSVAGVALLLISNGIIKKIDPEKSMF